MRKHFLLIYHYAPDYIERRAEFRPMHLALAAKASDAGDLILGGALLEEVEEGHCSILMVACCGRSRREMDDGDAFVMDDGDAIGQRTVTQ